MTSKVICLSGRGSSLSASFHPEIELDEQYDYSCCLLDMSIELPPLKAVLTKSNNVLSLHSFGEKKVFELPTGEQELEDIIDLIEDYVVDSGSRLSIWLNTNSMKYMIATDPFLHIDFTNPRSVGSVFGFELKKLHGNTTYQATHSVTNLHTETIRVNCDWVNASFHNGVRTHVLYEFLPKEFSNYKMVEQPHSLIYLPIGKQSINAINLTVTDQQGKRIKDLDGTQIVCRINIKRD